MDILVKGGRVVDPASGKDGIFDILVKDGIISEVSEKIDAKADRVIDADGLMVMPGLIDLHVHLREPGFTHKETIKTGAAAAAHGGYTTICPMPNTKPATDCVETLEMVKEIIDRDAIINVLPVSAVTIGQAGTELADIKAMAEHGAIAISEDGKSVMDSGLYEKAMVIAKEAGIPVLAHCEDKNLVGKGALNAGPKQKELGVEGISNAVEDIITARDIFLAKTTGAKLHLCHCSTEDSVRMVADAKADGVDVTAEVSPHHFMMCDEDIKGNDANYKMNPPLRSRADMEALRIGLRDNIMDVISTDHAPHAAAEKKKGIADAPFGIVGSETALCLTVTGLVKGGYLSYMQMAEKMSYNPAKVIGIDRGTLLPGKVADITIFNPDEEYTIDVNDFVSMGKNTPFNGMKVFGKVKYTIVSGKIVYEEK